MAGPLSGFARRLVTGSLFNELWGLLPEPARDSLGELRDYIAQHGRLPKLELLRRGPLGPTKVSAVSVVLADVENGEKLSMVNVLRGSLRGGELRIANAMVGDIEAGYAQGLDVLVGSVRGGLVERVNAIVGDIHGGEVRVASVIVGHVYGGRVQCNFLVGDVHGGEVKARNMLGTVHGGRADVDRQHG